MDTKSPRPQAFGQNGLYKENIYPQKRESGKSRLSSLLDSKTIRVSCTVLILLQRGLARLPHDYFALHRLHVF
jgi:hypothetical protein